MLTKMGLKIELSKCLYFKQIINYLGDLVSGTSILPLTAIIEALMNLKLSTNIKEVRHLFSLTWYYRKFICSYADIPHPLNCLTWKYQPFIWTPDCQSSFDMLCSCLANTPIVQVPDPNELYLLFMDISKYCFSGVLAQTSTEESNEALVKLLTGNDPLTSIFANTGH